MLPADSPFASPAAPGPHPATAELRAYAAGTLSAADEHRIEAHTLDCERCAELLDGFSMSNAPTTDHALAELRTRLQARVGHDLTEPVPLPASRPLWPRLAAAVALLGAVGAGIWGWQQQPAQAPAVATTTPPAAPATETPPAASPPVADASVAQAATQPPTAAATPAAAPAPPRPAEYAANRPANPRSQRQPALRSPAPAATILADRADTPAAADNWAATATSSPAGQVAAAPMAAPVARAANDESDAKEVLIAAPARAKKASAVSVADSSVASPQLAATSRFSTKAKAVESTALVRVTDKPMPTVPTIAPAPVSGTPALRNYLFREAAKFEPDEGERRLNGSVRLRFIVGADGKLSNLQVVRSLRADYDEEALRLVCEGPAWRPGIANGRRADLPMEVTVTF